jgi:hypothetical protein
MQLIETMEDTIVDPFGARAERLAALENCCFQEPAELLLQTRMPERTLPMPSYRTHIDYSKVTSPLLPTTKHERNRMICRLWMEKNKLAEIARMLRITEATATGVVYRAGLARRPHSRKESVECAP